MKEGGFNRLPKKVKEAIRKDDGAALSALGRAGNRAKAEKAYNKAIEQRNMTDAEAYYDEKADHEEWKRHLDANEHLLPIEEPEEENEDEK